MLFFFARLQYTCRYSNSSVKFVFPVVSFLLANMARWWKQSDYKGSWSYEGKGKIRGATPAPPITRVTTRNLRGRIGTLKSLKRN